MRIKDVKEKAALGFVKACLLSRHNTVEEKSSMGQNPSPTFPQAHFIIEEDLKYAIGKIGGRISDLQEFVQRVTSGATPRAAAARMIRGAISDIKTEGFGFGLMGAKGGAVNTPTVSG